MGSLSKTFKNKTVFVTGGTGFVGSRLVEKLLFLGANVISTYQSEDFIYKKLSLRRQARLTLQNLDVRNYEGLFNLATRFEVEYVFHLAAQPIVSVAYINPKECLDTNIMGTVNVLEVARNYPRIKATVIVTSDKAYGPLKQGNMYVETDQLKGDHPYDVSKTCADLIANTYWKTYGLPVAIARAGNIYGEGDINFSRIIPAIMKSLCTNEVLELRSNGKQIRDYLYIEDVVNGYLLLAAKIDKAKGEAFNFGSTDSYSALGLIVLIEKYLKKKVNYKILNNAKNELPYQSLNDQKAKLVLGWKREYSCAKEIKNIYKWYKFYLNG